MLKKTGFKLDFTGDSDMSEIEIIHDIDTFQDKVENLNAIIEENRKSVQDEYRKAGRAIPERITFEEFDLSSSISELLAIQKTLQSRSLKWKLSSRPCLRRKALTVAFAGICQLVRDHYVGAFWDIYESRIGWRQDSHVYSLWEETFEQERAELICTTIRREFVDSFVNEAGIPRSLQKHLVDFFLIYWRYFRHGNVEDLIDRETFDRDVPDSIIENLRAIVSNIREFKSAFVRRIERLIDIVSFIETSPGIKIGDVENNYRLIQQERGVDPREIIRNETRLHKIWVQIFSLITPSRFIATLSEFDLNEKILLPDGTQTTAQFCSPDQYGAYRYSKGLLTCVPDLSLDPEQIGSMPFDTIMRLGNFIFLKSENEIKIEIDGSIRQGYVKPFYLNKTFAGHVGFVRDHRYHPTIRIFTPDRRIDRTFHGKYTVDFSPRLRCVRNRRRKIVRLYATNLKVDIRNATSSAKKMDITVDSRSRALGSVCFDQRGNGTGKFKDLVFTDPQPEKYTFYGETGDNASEEVGNLLLDDVMLFSTKLGYQIPPGDPDQLSAAAGSGQFLLFMPRKVKPEEFSHDGMEVQEEEEYGHYRMITLQNHGAIQSRIKCRLNFNIK